jgi:hypothetical protein
MQPDDAGVEPFDSVEDVIKGFKSAEELRKLVLLNYRAVLEREQHRHVCRNTERRARVVAQPEFGDSKLRFLHSDDQGCSTHPPSVTTAECQVNPERYAALGSARAGTRPERLHSAARATFTPGRSVHAEGRPPTAPQNVEIPWLSAPHARGRLRPRPAQICFCREATESAADAVANVRRTRGVDHLDRL